MNPTVVLLALEAEDSARCAAVCTRLGLRVVYSKTESAFVARLLEPRAVQVGLVVPGGGLDIDHLLGLVRGIYRLRGVPLVVAGSPSRIVGAPERPTAEVEELTAALLRVDWNGPASRTG